MLAEAGHFSLILAMFISAVQSSLPLIGAARGDKGFMAVGSYAAVGACAFTLLAFAALTACFVASDFSVALVVSSSELAKPLLYKFCLLYTSPSPRD